jgi:uncharacterized protein involved in response to NO
MHLLPFASPSEPDRGPRPDDSTRPAFSSRSALDPYRVLFPIGLAYALIGAGVWPLYALGLLPYPGALHARLMLQGFEQCFVLGFLLTAMPAFTHGARCRPSELALATLSMLAFGGAALGGADAVAQSAFLLSLLLIVAALGRRAWGNPQPPPEEFQFVGLGMAMGLLGGALLLAGALGAGPPLPPRFAERLLSLGMVLSLVLGVGSLLVPAFAGIREPLVIPGLAAAHERRGRRPLYGMALRAVTATVMGLWVWKLVRLPGRRELHAYVLWSSGWMAILGLWMALLLPLHATAALHVTFIGGFALLTLGIGTRVAVSHGGHPIEVERRTLDVAVVACLALALALRLAAESTPARANRWLAASAGVWLAAWVLWGLRVMPRLVRTPERS